MKNVTPINKNQTQAKTMNQTQTQETPQPEPQQSIAEQIETDMKSLEEAMQQQTITLRALRTGTWPAVEVTNTAQAQALTESMVNVIGQQLSELKKALKKAGGKKSTKSTKKPNDKKKKATKKKAKKGAKKK